MRRSQMPSLFKPSKEKLKLLSILRDQTHELNSAKASLIRDWAFLQEQQEQYKKFSKFVGKKHLAFHYASLTTSYWPSIFSIHYKKTYLKLRDLEAQFLKRNIELKNKIDKRAEKLQLDAKKIVETRDEIAYFDEQESSGNNSQLQSSR